MKKYKAPDGNIYDESYLKDKYGSDFDTYVSNGAFVLVDDKASSNGQSKSGKYVAPDGNLYDESFLRNKYGSDFDTYVSNGTLKKKDGGAASVTTTGSEVPSSSNGLSSAGTKATVEDSRIKDAGNTIAKLGAEGTPPPEEAQKPVQPNVYDAFLNNPEIGVNSIIDSLQKEKAAKRAAVYPEQKTDNEALIRSKVLDTMNEYDKKLVGQVKNNYLTGKLTSEDVGVIVQHSNLIADKGNVNVQDIADKINERTKKLREQRTNIQGNPYDYKIQQRDLDEEIRATANIIAKGKIGIGAVSDLVSLSQTEEKLRELVNKKDFLEYRWQQDKYLPAFNKRRNEIIKDLESIGEVGDGIVADDHELRMFVNNYMGDHPEPVLIAGNGIAQYIGKAPGAKEGSVAAPNPEQPSFLYTNSKGESATFRNTNFTDLFNSVKQYFRTEKPAIDLADKKIKITDEFIKFNPLVNHKKQIADWFNEPNMKAVQAATDIQKEAIAESINQKYLNIIKLSPRYQEISDVLKNKIASGTLDEKDVPVELQKSLSADPELKKYFDNVEKEMYAAFTNVDKRKLDFITAGLKKIDPSLEMTSNGLSVAGASPEEFKKFSEAYKSALTSAFFTINEEHKAAANKAAQADIDKQLDILPKEFMATAEIKARSGFNNMVASFADYFNLNHIRDKAESAVSSDIAQESDFAKSSEWHGISSLLDPNYYASSMGQSLPYMAPAIVAGLLSGGTGTAAILSSAATGTLFETGLNMLDTYHDTILNGVKPNGEKVSIYEASRAMAQDGANEIIPNLILSWAEFGALFKGAPKQLKRTIGSEIFGAITNLAETGAAESSQEGIQGYFQYEAKAAAQQKGPTSFFDYMQTDDFRQNFFGGLAGGIGFGAGKFGKRVVMAPSTYNTWKGILETARDNYDSFNDNTSRGYALNEELSGRGDQFRDGLVLRIMKNDYENEQELAKLKNTYQYSLKLKAYGSQLKVNTQNQNGLAAVHHMIMADEYAQSAKTVGEETAAGKLYKEKAAASYEQAKKIYNGNAEGVYHVTNAATNTPIFLTERDAMALSENGDLQGLWNKGLISNVSDNLKIDKNKPQDPSKYSPDETIRREAAKGAMPGMYNDIVNDNPGLARQVLIELAGQKYGITSDGRIHPNGPAPIANKAVDDAVTELFPDRKSLLKTIYRGKRAEADVAEVIGQARNDDKELFGELFKTASSEYNFAEQNPEDVISAAYHKMQNISPEKRTDKQNKFINDVHKLVKTYQDAETIRSNQRQAGEEGDGLRQGTIKGGNDLQRTQKEETVNAETEQQAGEVTLPDHGVTVGEMIDRVGSYQGHKGKFIRRGDEVIFKADGFGGLTHVLGKFDDVVNRPVDDFGIQAQESVIAHSDGVFTIRGEKFVNNFKDPLEAVNKTKKGYAVTLENEKGQKRTFRGSIAEDIATQIFYQEIKKEENGKEQFERFVNSDPEVIQSIQDGGYTETSPAGAVDNTGEVLLEPKDQEIRDEEADLAEQTGEQKVAAEQTVEEQRAEAIKNALKPDIKMQFVPDDKLVGPAADRFGMIDDQNRIKDDFEKLNELIDCCYG